MDPMEAGERIMSSSENPPFVLIHGGRHGGWAWRDVASRLRRLGHDEEVRVVGAAVGDDPPRGGIDGGDRLLAELDAILGDLVVVELHLLSRLATEHHLKLGEAEEERLVAIEKREERRRNGRGFSSG